MLLTDSMTAFYLTHRKIFPMNCHGMMKKQTVMFIFRHTIYPDGDYHFFIAQDFLYGIMGHTWRKELWVFRPNFLILKASQNIFYRQYQHFIILLM